MHAWLKETAAKRRQPMQELVAEAVRQMEGRPAGICPFAGIKGKRRELLELWLRYLRACGTGADAHLVGGLLYWRDTSHPNASEPES